MAPMWVVFATIALAVGQTNAACSFRFTALLSAHPLLLADNEYTDVRRLLPVDANANIVLATGANITLACPGSYNYFLGGNTQPLQVMTATCDSGYNFIANGRTIVLNQIKCYSESYRELRVGTQWNVCRPDTLHVEVGYNIPTYPSFFLKAYEVCFDQSTLTPVSTQHYLRPGGRAARTGTMNAYLFIQVEPSEAYVTTAQTQSFTRQLDSASAKKYITSSNYLEPRLIVPKDDFVYGQLQLSAYFYINSAPMWRAVSSSYWGSMETALRTLAITEGDLLVYTTLIGVAELSNSNGERKPMHLFSNNGESYMPLPDILARSVYNSKQEQVVFLQFPHRGAVARSQLTERVCAEDVCAQLRWLPWRNVPPAERPMVTCCRADDALLRRRLPRALSVGSSPSAGLLVGRAEHYD